MVDHCFPYKVPIAPAKFPGDSSQPKFTANGCSLAAEQPQGSGPMDRSWLDAAVEADEIWLKLMMLRLLMLKDLFQGHCANLLRTVGFLKGVKRNVQKVQKDPKRISQDLTMRTVNLHHFMAAPCSAGPPEAGWSMATDGPSRTHSRWHWRWRDLKDPWVTLQPRVTILLRGTIWVADYHQSLSIIAIFGSTGEVVLPMQFINQRGGCVNPPLTLYYSLEMFSEWTQMSCRNRYAWMGNCSFPWCITQGPKSQTIWKMIFVVATLRTGPIYGYAWETPRKT